MPDQISVRTVRGFILAVGISTILWAVIAWSSSILWQDFLTLHDFLVPK
jgi:hypothetical protein